jgi:hypothetical protein
METITLCSCSVDPIFQDSPRVAWSADNKQLFVTGNATVAPAAAGPTGFTTTVIPWQGIAAFSSASLVGGGARQIPATSVAPGPTGTRYAFARTVEQSNLYRIRVP